MLGHSQSRRGKSLIEMLVVIITMSTILTIAAQMLHRLSRAERSVREAGVISQAEMRFARMFRRDARGADSAELLPEGSGIRFGSQHGSVVYEARTDSIVRTLEGGDARGRDGFRLGSTDAAFSIDSGRFASATITPRRPESPTPRISAASFQVVAAIGADGRVGGESAGADGLNRTAPASQRTPVEAPKPGEETT